MARAATFAGRVVTFGESAAADVRAEEVDDRGLAGMRVRVRTRQGTTELQVPLLGRGNLANVLAAAAVATEMNVPLEELPARAANLRPALHRGSVLRLARGVTVVDDSYNSSPAALQKALDVIAQERGVHRKAAVLGEMLELGEHAARLHHECGRAAAAAGLDRLVTVGGPAAKVLADAAIGGGMNQDAVTWTPTSAAAADAITAWIQDGDLVLVKGSRGVKTDAVVERLAAEFAE
jgi:UDP-N-acetylmuramoyl-tripeptide--D-alanyl-D-alanine ligase